MCDCYTGKCETCGCDIAIHIADFCTGRENAFPYCPRCTRKIIKQGLPTQMRVFKEDISREDQVAGRKIGQEVVILCNDFNAYGVHLN